MNKFAIGLLILLSLCLPQLSFAQDWPRPVINAAEFKCDEPVTRACAGALRELLAARAVIESQARQIEALQLRLDLEKERLDKMAEVTSLQAQQNEALQNALAAEQESRAILQQMIAARDEQIAKLELKTRKLKRQRVIAAVAGIAVGAIIRR